MPTQVPVAPRLRRTVPIRIPVFRHRVERPGCDGGSGGEAQDYCRSTDISERRIRMPTKPGLSYLIADIAAIFFGLSAAAAAGVLLLGS